MYNYSFPGCNLVMHVLGNVLLAIGLTYISMTGQLGWIIDAIVSFGLWVLELLFGGQAEIWLRLKSMLNDVPQLCPYCSKPFSGKRCSGGCGGEWRWQWWLRVVAGGGNGGCGGEWRWQWWQGVILQSKQNTGGKIKG
ncbi:hypothetical protein Hanom_Chr09g00768901 [Helianthus anomalus]